MLPYTLLLYCTLFCVCVPTVVAQTISWEPSRGPYGGTISQFVQTPDGDIYAASVSSGIYHSTDGGTTWSLSGNGLPQTFYYDIIVDSIHQQLLVATGKGIYHRESVSKALWEHDSDSFTPQSPTHLAINQREGLLYALSNNSIYRRIHPDSSWTVVYTGGYISNLAISPSTGIVYAADAQSVIYSTDIGTTWETITDSLFATNTSITLVAGTEGAIYAESGKRILALKENDTVWHDITQGLRDSISHKISVAPDGSLYATNARHEIYRSTNPGDKWELYSDSSAIAPVTLWFVDDTTLLTSARNDYGVARSTDGGRHWQRATNDITGLSLYTVWSSSSNVLYTGTSYPFLYYSTSGGEQWERTDVPTTLPSQVTNAFVELSDSSVMIGTSRGILYSADGRHLWEPRNVGFRTSFEQTINDLATLSNDKVFAATHSGVFRSIDTGRHWYQVGLGGYSVPAIVASSNGILYAGTADFSGSPLWRSIDSGLTWEQVVSEMHVSDLATLSDSTVFAATPRGLFRSTDQGVTWQRSPLDPNDTTIIAVAINPHGPVLAASASAVYASFDNGQTWSNQSEGLRGRISDVAFDNEGHAMVSTWGGGIVISSRTTSSASAPSSQQPIIHLSVAPNPARTVTHITFSTERTGTLQLEVIDATGQQVAILLQGRKHAGSYTTTWDTSAMPPGLYYIRLRSGALVQTQGIVVVK